MQSFVTLHYWAGKAMLTHFSPMLHFCTPTFSGGIEMKCWAGKSYVNSLNSGETRVLIHFLVSTAFNLLFRFKNSVATIIY